MSDFFWSALTLGAEGDNLLGPELSNFLLVSAAIGCLLCMLRHFDLGTSIIELHRAEEVGAIFRLDVLSQHDVEEAEREIVPRQHFERNQRERRQIKHPPTDVKCSDIPFVVNRQSLQIKRKGYEAGASDSEEDSSDSEKEFDESDLLCQLKFKVDCASPCKLELYWGVTLGELQSILRWEDNDIPNGDVEEETEDTDSFFESDGSIAMTVFSRQTNTSEERDTAPLLSRSALTGNKNTAISDGNLFPSCIFKTEHPDWYGSGLQQTFEYEFSSTWLKHEVLNSDGMCPLAIVLSSTQLPPIYQVTAVNITASSTRKRPLSADVAGQYLVTEHQALELKEIYGLDSEPDCVICLCDPKDTVLFPCFHFSVCKECVLKIGKCPVCRTRIHTFWRFKEPKELYAETA